MGATKEKLVLSLGHVRTKALEYLSDKAPCTNTETSFLGQNWAPRLLLKGANYISTTVSWWCSLQLIAKTRRTAMSRQGILRKESGR